MNVDHITRRGNAAQLRLSMETQYIGPEGLLDFDTIFAAAEKLEAGEQTTDDLMDNIVGDAQDRVAPVETATDAGPAGSGATPLNVDADGDPAAPADAAEVECGECGAAKQPDRVCGACGFDPDVAPPPSDADAPPDADAPADGDEIPF